MTAPASAPAHNPSPPQGGPASRISDVCFARKHSALRQSDMATRIGLMVSPSTSEDLFPLRHLVRSNEQDMLAVGPVVFSIAKTLKRRLIIRGTKS